MRWLWLLCAAGIAYGSLYPFAFDRALPEHGVLAELLASLSSRPSRGDLVSNLVLYLPFGLVGMLALTPTRSAAISIAIVTLCGGAESLGLEILQLLDRARGASLWDWATNVLSTAAGATSALAIRRERLEWFRDIAIRDRFALLLVACWFAYRLAPWVPTLDLAHVKQAVKALRDADSLQVGTCLRLTVAWLVVQIGWRTGFLRPPHRLVLPALACATACAPVALVGRTLRVEDFLAIALAFALQTVLAPSRRSTLAVLVGHALTLLAVQLEPFRFTNEAQPFSWIPFSGILQGSREVGVFAVFEKFFLYGVAIWLPVRLGSRLAVTTTVVAACTLATELLQTRLAGRTPEIGEPLIAVFAGLMCGALRMAPRYRAAP